MVSSDSYGYSHILRSNLLEVIEIIRKMEQGKTEPYLCTANNDNKYIVKGSSTGGRGRIAEWICAHLGREFGLPIPDYEIIDVPEYLIQDDSDYFHDIGLGPAFASKYIPQLQEVNQTIIDSIQPNTLRDIFVFDFWVNNEDRTWTHHGGNPNLIYGAAEKEIIVFDHNNAFDNDFEVDAFKKYHVGSLCWFQSQRDLLVINEYKDRMRSALTKLESAIDSIPEEWFSCNSVENELIIKITTCLSSCESDSFWEVLL